MEQELPEALNSLQADLSRLTQKKEDNLVHAYTSPSSASATLQDSIDELLLMFKRANEELTLEQREEKLIRSQLDPVFKKLNELGEQQETMANAIVSISDAIENLTSSVNEIKARISAAEISNMMPRGSSQTTQPIQPQFTQPNRPSYQRFDFNTTQLSPAQQMQQQNVMPLPPPPNPPFANQAIPDIKPNEFGQKKSLFE